MDTPLGTVASEFAAVAVSIDHEGNGARLRLEDLSGGRVAFLDALQLETLVWLPPEQLTALLDPSANRWRDSPPTS
ncbi:MAG TPA: hypothetical protein VK735_16585 [Pseudonocardia sp.]|uniref:hypothetical protein n=1 Tax=Pseudonocardia sp. TaxID=60912 RepID=UPI002CBCE2CB|nr:hypothetical protein [Pseudonocardia sp.]HTF49064.1 hypothetical protein [Pseudonocardia sp.]